MKKINCFKNILILFFTLTSFSCSNLFEQELGQSISESSNAFITLSVGSGDGSRTVLPGAEESELTTLVLKGTKEGESERSLGSWASVSEMRNAAIPLSTGSWTFTLTAKKGGTSFCGSTSKNINVGENSLSFEMKISDSGSGAGSFSVSLNFESAPNADKVTKAVATLENLDGSSVTGVNAQALIPVEKAVTFSADGIIAGTYRAKVIFYSTQGDRDLELATYRELVQISDSLVSTATRTIESFDNLYTITYDTKGVVLPVGITLPETVTRKSTAIALPDLSRDYYTFDGWYTTEAFVDGTKVTSLANFTANVNVYAKFTPVSWNITYYLNDGTNADGAIISYTVEDNVIILEPNKGDEAFAGFFTTSDFSGSPIAGWNAGEKHENIILYAKWDGIRLLAEEAVEKIKAMTECGTIKIYGSLTTNLLKNIIAELKKKSDCLISFDLSETTGLTEVSERMFLDCSNFEKVVLPDTVTSMGKECFSGCSSLKELTIPFVGSGSISPDNYYAGGSGNLFGNIFDLTSSYNYSTGTYDSVETKQLYYNGDDKLVQVSFYNIPESLKKVTVLGGKIYTGAFSCCKYIEEIELHNIIPTSPVIKTGTYDVYIGKAAFRGCSGLKKLYIPESVTAISYQAFKQCPELQEITFEDTSSEWKRSTERITAPSIYTEVLGKMRSPEENAFTLKTTKDYYYWNDKYTNRWESYNH